MTDVVSTDRNQGKNQLRVGRLVKAHGLKGALKLELYTDNPERRFTTGAEFTLQVPEASPWHGKTVVVREYRVMNGNPVVFFKDVDDREGAETLVRAILWIDQDNDEVEDNAWFDHQLTGLDVVRDGVVVGKVVRIEHFPAQDLLIVRSGDQDIMVPFVEAIVPTVDVSAGRVIVTPPAGLFEELPDASEATEAAESSDADATE
ncbi:ribosome maturation factor RimM [Microbacterium sp. NPDC088619]|uniref:ribosome maturation factor RimM n=1 Tax=Microbacterium sp. NPDC088619 TaxID=3364196 RepID=UPI003819FC45